MPTPIPIIGASCGEVGVDGMADKLDKRDADADTEERYEDRRPIASNEPSATSRITMARGCRWAGADPGSPGTCPPSAICVPRPAARLRRSTCGSRRASGSGMPALVELHGCVGNSAVARHLPRPRSRVRADDRAHARHSATSAIALRWDHRPPLKTIWPSSPARDGKAIQQISCPLRFGPEIEKPWENVDPTPEPVAPRRSATIQQQYAATAR